VLEFHAEAPQATESERLAHGPYVSDGAGFEPTILRLTTLPMSHLASQMSNISGCCIFNCQDITSWSL